ncbi:hypothetical protein HN011_010650 [Eciton burchellii]|nr:hypothetical protein HN011_010650 [Eciton burchellii]
MCPRPSLPFAMPSNDRQWRSGNRIPYGIVIHNKIVREQVKRTAGTVDNDDDGNHVACHCTTSIQKRETLNR